MSGSSFLLQVSGVEISLLWKKGRTPKNGDVVIAEVDGDWTMNYFRKDGKDIYLETANPKYPIIRPAQELKIGGVVTQLSGNITHKVLH